MASTHPSQSKDAHPLDPDAHPWERQPDEPDEQYAMFVEWRDMEDRRFAVFDTDPYLERGWTKRRAEQVSSKWSWGYRSFCWDRYLGQVDTEELVRYRRFMNQRHRNVARHALNKFATWLVGLDPATLKPMEAARLAELAVAMERAAAQVEPLVVEDGDLDGEIEDTPRTLRDMAGIDPTVEADLARALHEILPPRP